MLRPFEDKYRIIELKGKMEGKQEERERIAKELLKRGMEKRAVSEITGLTDREMTELLKKVH